MTSHRISLSPTFPLRLASSPVMPPSSSDGECARPRPCLLHGLFVSGVRPSASQRGDSLGDARTVRLDRALRLRVRVRVLLFAFAPPRPRLRRRRSAARTSRGTDRSKPPPIAAHPAPANRAAMAPARPVVGRRGLRKSNNGPRSQRGATAGRGVAVCRCERERVDDGGKGAPGRGLNDEVSSAGETVATLLRLDCRRE